MENNTVVLFPGGFKPPHSGHLAIANWLADTYTKVYIIIGKKDRDGITAEKSKHVWDLLPINDNIEVIISPDSTPIVTAYKYLFTVDTDNNITVGLASSNKETDNRSQQFVDNIEKYKVTSTKDGNYIKKNVYGTVVNYDNPLVYKNRTDDKNGLPISATILRNDLKNKDFNNFSTNYPNVDINIIKEIYKYLIGMTAERREIYKKVIREMLENDIDDNFLNAITSTDPNEINKFITAINNNTRKYIAARNNAINSLKQGRTTL